MAANPAELYNAVLVDTPLAPFFVDCISEQDLDEMNIEIIRNTLYKAYLEAFYEFCKGLGGTTADVMCEILAVSRNNFRSTNCVHLLHFIHRNRFPIP